MQTHTRSSSVPGSWDSLRCVTLADGENAVWNDGCGVTPPQWLCVCVCDCSRLLWLDRIGSLAVRQGLVLRHEQRLGLLLPPGPALSSSHTWGLDPWLASGGGGSRHSPTGETHYQRVTWEGSWSGTCTETEIICYVMLC